MKFGPVLYLLFIAAIFFVPAAHAQAVQNIFKKNIVTVQLHTLGNQQGLPVYTINSGERLQLGFDDLDGGYKNYYYAYMLCDYNWKEVNLNPFDYIKGFTINRLNTYRYSSVAFTKYTHYQAVLPENNAVPTRSGNYLLKVFLDGDTSRLVFTRQMLVLQPKAAITATIVQPFTPALFTTHQRVRFTATVAGINAFSAAQQIKVVVLQNNRWDNAQRDIVPTFVRGNVLEYNTEQAAVFPAGKEFRWLDIRSFRLQSDRVERAIYGKTATEIFAKTEKDMSANRYLYFPDYNGMYHISTYEALNPLWQGDYATVNFSFTTPDGLAYPNKNLYLAAAFTDYKRTNDWKMLYNEETGRYAVKAFLKQGYYNYAFVTEDKTNPSEINFLEGNYWEAENSYTILVYYKSFTDRSDQLIGVSQINSRNDRPGFSF